MRVKAEIKNNTFQVAQKCSIEMKLQSSEDLEPGDKIEVQFPNSWLTISTSNSVSRKLETQNSQEEHCLNVSCPGKNSSSFRIEIKERHLPFEEGPVRHGRHIVATTRDSTIPAGTLIHFLYDNTIAPIIAERETVWVRIKGNPPENEPVLIVTPDEAEDMRIIVPSGVEPGQTFYCLIVSLDKFENCSCTRYGNQCLRLSSGEAIADGLNFVGRIQVPVCLNEQGVYRFKMGKVVSNAIRVKKGIKGPYWGDIHIHTKLSHDGQGNDPYGYAREVSGLDFAGVVDHWESLGEPGYRQMAQWSKMANKPGTFITIPGYERNPQALGGHHNIYFRNEEMFQNSALRFDPSKVQEEQNEWEHYKPDSVMIIPHHTGISFFSLPKNGKGRAIDLDACDDCGLRPVVEIYSVHGQSELYCPQHVLAYEFNRMRGLERRACTSMPGPYYAQDYWMAGRRLGAIASSDSHHSQGGKQNWGITALWAKGLTRESVFDAIRSRQCYATTGERILIDFSVDGIQMGCCEKRKKCQKLAIRLQVWGTSLLLRLEILRYRFGIDKNFVPIESIAPRPESMDGLIEIEDEFQASCIYYARVTQKPLERPAMAWTSPIWIDILEEEK